MNAYEKLLQKASDEKIRVIESYDLNGNGFQAERLDGLYIEGNVALDKDLNTTVEKACVLAEELGHYYTTYGNIINQTLPDNRKQEYKARLRGYDMKIGLTGVIQAYEQGCHTSYDMAEYLEVTEKYLLAALNCYQNKYGSYVCLDNYVITFMPNLSVCKMIGTSGKSL